MPTQRLNTGRSAQYPDTGGGSVDFIDKAFFTHNGLLPGSTFFEQQLDFPAFDFSNPNGGTVFRSMSLVSLSGASNPANSGWDLLSAKSTVLQVVGDMRSNGSFNVGFFLSPTLPGAAVLPDNSYLWLLQASNSTVTIFKQTAGPTYTQLGSSSLIGPGNNVADGYGFAAYYDHGTNRLVLLVRDGSGRWFPAVDITDSSFTTFRYCGVTWSPQTAQAQALICPVAIYTN